MEDVSRLASRAPELMARGTALEDSTTGRLHIGGEAYRAAARRRWRGGLLLASVWLPFAAGVIVFDARLMLLVVVTGFLVFGRMSSARRALREDPSDSDVEIAADRLCIDGRDRGRVVEAVQRERTTRLFFQPGLLYRLAIDGRRYPDAFVDLPLHRQESDRLCRPLKEAGVTVRARSRLGDAWRLALALTLAIAVLVGVKVGLATLVVWVLTALSRLGGAAIAVILCAAVVFFVVLEKRSQGRPSRR